MNEVIREPRLGHFFKWAFSPMRKCDFWIFIGWMFFLSLDVCVRMYFEIPLFYITRIFGGIVLSFTVLAIAIKVLEKEEIPSYCFDLIKFGLSVGLFLYFTAIYVLVCLLVPYFFTKKSQ